MLGNEEYASAYASVSFDLYSPDVTTTTTTDPDIWLTMAQIALISSIGVFGGLIVGLMVYRSRRRKRLRIAEIDTELVREIDNTLNTLLALVIVAMITYGSISAAYVSTVEGEHEVGLLNYPIWPGRIALAIGLFTLCLQYVVDILNGFFSYLRKGEVE